MSGGFEDITADGLMQGMGAWVETALGVWVEITPGITVGPVQIIPITPPSSAGDAHVYQVGAVIFDAL
ncbi:predicted protein [Chaetomium globosum CBS 148.51]|uniref:Uncharacterized protein n=1 Tax=Chaetomium globosum (strain ATCC 6205 / CBS 148.51 / DSM 1962 / NBRC 6347 / NRRL 1970) TaxID=306901 RepID=Q2GYR9_CHAGB|nr:uncharacterized protein CHGG_06885 [Chaetomium globosum CBS 148.51]EAQ85632.1 predicted protein [Chaetomium globosum CBS 148.51]